MSYFYRRLLARLGDVQNSTPTWTPLGAFTKFPLPQSNWRTDLVLCSNTRGLLVGAFCSVRLRTKGFSVRATVYITANVREIKHRATCNSNTR